MGSGIIKGPISQTDKISYSTGFGCGSATGNQIAKAKSVVIELWRIRDRTLSVPEAAVHENYVDVEMLLVAGV